MDSASIHPSIRPSASPCRPLSLSLSLHTCIPTTALSVFLMYVDRSIDRSIGAMGERPGYTYSVASFPPSLPSCLACLLCSIAARRLCAFFFQSIALMSVHRNVKQSIAGGDRMRGAETGTLCLSVCRSSVCVCVRAVLRTIRVGCAQVFPLTRPDSRIPF